MQAVKNMKIRPKLLITFGITLIFLVGISVAGIYSLNKTDRDYTEILEHPQGRMIQMLKVETYLQEMRAFILSDIVNISNPEAISANEKLAHEKMQQIYDALNEYTRLLKDDPILTPELRTQREAAISSLLASITEFDKQTITPILKGAKDGDVKAILGAIAAGTKNQQYLFTQCQELAKSANELVNKLSNDLTAESNKIEIIIIVVAVLAVIISIIISLLISNGLANRASYLVNIANEVAEGNLNVNIDSSTKDEMGMLAESFKKVVASVNGTISDIGVMYKRHEEGEMDARIDVTKYKGEYKTLSEEVNVMTESYILMLQDIFKVLTAFGEGKFDTHLKPYKGQKSVANKEMAKLRNIIQSIVKDIDGIALAGSEGRLSQRANVEKYAGSWAEILKSLNDVLNAMGEPITEAQEVLGEMAKGNFSTAQMKGNYKGDFNQIKVALNSTNDSVLDTMGEVGSILEKISNGDLRTKITREYRGDYVSMKTSINNIVDSLNETMYGISIASEQVLAGAKDISNSSMILAEGATEQASSIEELQSTIETISEALQVSAQSATDANELSLKSMGNAKQGNSEMSNMLEAMNGIREASNNISKIIKVINDISFQTNLLALNAAVEAARAGQYGKGFAVVAEEVRNLAGRSQTAAKETTALIEDSISRVSEGTRLAELTANSLTMIVGNATEVSEVIAKILHLTNEQASALSQVSVGVEEISRVVQVNSATSEETASASTELNQQAEVMQQKVEFFKIKK